MRTTVNLDPDTDAAVRTLMRERGLSFRQAVNAAIRQGLSPRPSGRFETRTYRMGRPMMPIDKALRLAADLDDEKLPPLPVAAVGGRPVEAASGDRRDES